MKKSNKMVTGKEKKVTQKFFLPDHGVSIEAQNIEDAQNKAQKINSKK